MIGVLDYGVGNVGSILNMLRRVGAHAELASRPESLFAASKLVLPGVGAFDNGMHQLKTSGLVDPLREAVIKKKTPILGICLGMQMLGSGSEEGKAEGLGFIEAHCQRLRIPAAAGLKVPHMGWNLIKPSQQSQLFLDVGPNARFYFVHSYHMICKHPSNVLAITTYGDDFVSMVGVGNIMGAQFHPEKSHRFGMTLLKNFAQL